jgi:uncharacterized lipoprotein YmbA
LLLTCITDFLVVSGALIAGTGSGKIAFVLKQLSTKIKKHKVHCQNLLWIQSLNLAFVLQKSKIIQQYQHLTMFTTLWAI